jgi:serine/threonine-protein kinase
LNHEGIVRLHHFEAHDPSFGPYLVIEYVDWLTGDKWISNAGSRGLPVGAVMSVGTKLCRALAYAHERHVLHGDIKPANFFVDHAAESAKLSDWGLARLGRFETSESLLLRVEGTPAYMAPEQREPGRKIGPATDVYLLAASLWECLMGDVPPKDALRAALVNDERLPAARTLQNALLADPAARPTAAEFARMLSSVAGRSAYAS